MEETEFLPNKRLKTESPTPSSLISTKGEEKMEEMEEVAAGGGGGDADRTCGICFSEGRRSIRGLIDSCDHYFCFVCIMEWAKVESRCPMCKHRFGSIRRPPVRGVFPCERVVDVPIRQQVYHLHGNATVQFDPYAHVTCSACHSSADEELLLLCDLCDSGAHTYCVGLGYTVPEGDWYCPDCTISRNEHLKTQTDDDCSNQYCFRTSTALQEAGGALAEAGSHVSIFEIVCDETSFDSLHSSEIQILRRETDDDRPPSSSTAVERDSQGTSLHSDQEPSLMVPIRETASTSPEATLDGQGARPLRHCRNLHDRIKKLRENWGALRSGSLTFSSSFVSSGGMDNNREHNSRGVISCGSRQMQSPSSAHNEEVIAAVSVSSEINSCRSSRDVNKAWKMMDIAKSIQQTRKDTGRPRTDYPSTKCLGKRNIPRNKALQHRVLCSTGSESHCHYSLEAVQKKCKSQNWEKQKPDKHAMKELLLYDKVPPLLSSTQDSKSIREVLCHGKEGQAPLHGLHETSISTSRWDVRACSGSFTCFLSGTFSPPPSKMKPVGSLGCKIVPHQVKSGVDKIVDGSPIRSHDSAKSEVQSLVKLNLKLRRIDRHLGADMFKEVARIATHTILAACGFECSKSNLRHIPSSVCQHDDRVKHLRRSNLMPSSCRECFFSFVKVVVDSVISEKTILANKSLS